MENKIYGYYKFNRLTFLTKLSVSVMTTTLNTYIHVYSMPEYEFLSNPVRTNMDWIANV
jgi:hypothetical protein